MRRAVPCLLTLLAVTLLVVAGYLTGRHKGRQDVLEHLPQVDTSAIIQEMVDTSAIIASVVPAGSEVIRISHLDSLQSLASKPPVIVEVEKPVLVIRDSIVYVSVPISSYTFQGCQDDVDYLIQAQGYDVTLGSVKFRYPQTTITKTISVPRKCHWGIGVQGGFGVSPGGLTPYIGLGIQYNLLSW